MAERETTEAQAVAPEARMALGALAVALIAIGLPLNVAPSRTDELFAWTIEPQTTAATLGACYWGSCVLVALAATRSRWVEARVAVPGIVVAGTFLLGTTFLHWDTFHMEDWTGWLWLILYAILPPAAALMLWRQRRMPGGEPPKAGPLPRWALLALGAQGVLLVALGGALYAAPANVAEAWPWDVGVVSARALGSWAMAIGAAALLACREGDWRRIRPGMLGYAAIAALALLALVLFPDPPGWGGATAVLYVAFLLVMVATGVFAVAAGRRARVRPAPAVAAP